MIELVARISFSVGVAVVTGLSLSPQDALPGIDSWDKLLHVSAYAVLGLAGGLGFQGACSRCVVAAGLLALGCILEVAQVTVPGRTPSIADALAGSGGVVLGLVTVWVGNRLLSQYKLSSL